MRRFADMLAFAVLAASVSHNPADAAITGLQRVADGLSAPIFATHAPGDRNRLFIAQRGGAIRILDLNTGVLQTTPFLTMTGISQSGEGGFLGLAFHPDYFDDQADGYGKFYVKVTTSGSALTARIREFSVSDIDPNLADPGSLREVLSYTNPQSNHVGGWIGFSPNNKYLYIANGDGGGSNDNGTGHTNEPTVKGNAQDITNNFLGKMLRIDPLDPDGMGAAGYSIPPTNPMVAGVGSSTDDIGDDEIWSYGLRNPFRASFDRTTGDMWIGDVGQDNREEIDFEAASSAGGLNYGWRLREGDIATPTPLPPGTPVGGAPPANHTPPVYAYTHPDATVGPLSPSQYNGRLVTGGYVYRGPDPSLQGKYFFLDATSNNHWMVDTDPFGTVTNIDSQLTVDTGTASNPVSFGEDAVGNLYIAYIGSGELYRIATNQLLTGDYNADGEVDQLDLDKWQLSFGMSASNLAADGNGDGVVNAADYLVVRKFLGNSVHDEAGSGGATVPEPSAAMSILSILAVAVLDARRLRHKSPPDASQ